MGRHEDFDTPDLEEDQTVQYVTLLVHLTNFERLLSHIMECN